ncbi:hypothetical protein Poli38472_009195 [Pythium oligandrum]|uniref:Uncharacterized protein n=1 Tax=Pythium oligandrum TaxID=41045 RepID=A0A8K1CL92_PYTOL|nr:hypothetical protein Poli38472_009195 [Pythium oligandrum]|eukprot:TMW65028.1 hypothetical protein Poli38472_009195 [Pythium oligandrum]
MLRRNRKRARAEASDTNAGPIDDDIDEFSTPDITPELDDTLATLQLLIQRNEAGFIRIDSPPIIFTHQLYTVLSNRTAVDQSLYRFRQDGTLVCFRIPTGPDEYAVIRQSDFKSILRKWEAALRPVDPITDKSISVANDEKIAALVALQRALPRLAAQNVLTTDVLIDVLTSTLGGDDEEAFRTHIKNLQRLGFLLTTPQLDNQAYQLSVPGVGKLVTAVKKTRSDILSVLKRTKYKEAFEHQLKKTKLRRSKLDMEYHLTDMEGCGLVRRTQVTSGTLVSLVNK